MLHLFEIVSAQPDLAPGTYPFYDVLDKTPTTETILTDLSRAVLLDQGSYTARWGLGRAAMVVGDAQTAADTFNDFTDSLNENPLLNEDVFLAQAQTGQLRNINWYNPLPTSNLLADQAAFALLNFHHSSIATDQAILDQVILLRPDDLFANYHLRKLALAREDSVQALDYGEKLVYFSLEALQPYETQLLLYVSEVIPLLLGDEIWDKETTRRVVAFLVWQHNDSEHVETLLELLLSRYPSDADWHYFLAEYFHRGMDLQKAEIEYRQTILLDPDYAQAYLRLGMIYETRTQDANAQMSSLTEAVNWYSQYFDLAPDDYLIKEKLLGLSRTITTPWLEQHNDLLGESGCSQFLADELNVPLNAVNTGSNLVGNGSFSAWEEGSPIGWKVGTYLGDIPDLDAAVFFAGEDSLMPDTMKVARILVLRNELDGNDFVSLAEYVGESFSLDGGQYLFSLKYALEDNGAGNGFVFLGDYTTVNGTVLMARRLSDTSGEWELLCSIVENPLLLSTTLPVLRNWSIGDLKFQQIELRFIESPGLD